MEEAEGLVCAEMPSDSRTPYLPSQAWHPRRIRPSDDCAGRSTTARIRHRRGGLRGIAGGREWPWGGLPHPRLPLTPGAPRSGGGEHGWKLSAGQHFRQPGRMRPT